MKILPLSLSVLILLSGCIQVHITETEPAFIDQSDYLIDQDTVIHLDVEKNVDLVLEYTDPGTPHHVFIRSKQINQYSTLLDGFWYIKAGPERVPVPDLTDRSPEHQSWSYRLDQDQEILIGIHNVSDLVITITGNHRAVIEETPVLELIHSWTGPWECTLCLHTPLNGAMIANLDVELQGSGFLMATIFADQWSLQVNQDCQGSRDSPGWISTPTGPDLTLDFEGYSIQGALLLHAVVWYEGAMDGSCRAP